MINNVLQTVAWSLVLAAILSLPAVLFKFKLECSYRKIFGFLGIAYLLLFFLTVTVPYHSQGYR